MRDTPPNNRKQALVTGGTRGIGRAISLALAETGAAVIANHARDTAAADALAEEARSRGLDIRTFRADLTNGKALVALREFVGESSGTLSTWVHCAATGVHRPFADLTDRHFDWVFALNVKAFFQLAGLLRPVLAPGAAVVYVSSRGAVRSVPQYALMGATKGAGESLSRHLAAEWAPDGIRVNILAPGSVRTDAWNVMPDSEARLAETVRRTPLKRLVTLDEVARAAVFLCSDASAGIVGQTLVVDGGASIVE